MAGDRLAVASNSTGILFDVFPPSENQAGCLAGIYLVNTVSQAKISSPQIADLKRRLHPWPLSMLGQERTTGASQ